MRKIFQPLPESQQEFYFLFMTNYIKYCYSKTHLLNSNVLPKNETKKQDNPALNKNKTYGNLRPSLSKMTCILIYARISTKAEMANERYGFTPKIKFRYMHKLKRISASLI